MAADTMGVFNCIFLENCDLILTSLGRTSENAGRSSTSSKVRPSETILSRANDIV
jgi:hypothetical protein